MRLTHRIVELPSSVISRFGGFKSLSATVRQNIGTNVEPIRFAVVSSREGLCTTCEVGDTGWLHRASDAGGAHVGYHGNCCG